MATPDIDSGADAQDTAEAFDETHNTDEDVSPDETRSFAPDLFDDVYDVTRAEGDEDDDDEALDAADYDPDDLDDDDLEEDDDAEAYLDSDTDLDDDDDDEDEEAEDGILAAPSDDAELEYTDHLDDIGRTDNRMARRYESSRELSEDQVEILGYRRPREEVTDEDETTGSGACADDVPDESHLRQEELLDEAIEESFPASDPVSVKRIT